MRDCENKDLIRPLARLPNGTAVVARHRPDHTQQLSTMRSSRDGAPMAPGEEYVTTRNRGDGTFEVTGSYAHGAPPSSPSKPAQVATDDYRDGWERTFSARGGQA